MHRLPVRGAALVIAVAVAAPAAEKLEQPKVTVAVGGRSLFYYLPLTLAERLGYFKDEGLDLQIADFPGGAKALQALVGGSADVVSGAFEHVVDMHAKGIEVQEFVLQDRYSGIVLGLTKAKAGDLQVAQGPARHEDRCHRAGIEHQHLRQRAARARRARSRRGLHHRGRASSGAVAPCRKARWRESPTSTR